MMNENAYADDFKETKIFKFAYTKGNTHCINKSKLITSCLSGLTMEEIKYKNKTPKTKRSNTSSSAQYRHSNFALHEAAL